MSKREHNIPAPIRTAEQPSDISSDLAQMSLLIILGFIAFLPSHTPWTVFPFFVFAWMLCWPILRRRIVNPKLRFVAILVTGALLGWIAWNVVPQPQIHAILQNMNPVPYSFENGRPNAAAIRINIMYKNSGDEASYRTTLATEYDPIPINAVDDSIVQRLKAKVLRASQQRVETSSEGDLYPNDSDIGTINDIVVPLDWRWRLFLRGRYGVYVYGIVTSTSTIHTRRTSICGVEVMGSLPWNCNTGEKELP
jgi:hypothetical protein